MPGLVNAEVSVWELQDVRVEGAPLVRVADVEDGDVHSGGRDEPLSPVCVVLRVLDPVANSDQLTPPICVFSRQTRKLGSNSKNHF